MFIGEDRRKRMRPGASFEQLGVRLALQRRGDGIVLPRRTGGVTERLAPAPQNILCTVF